MKVVNRHSVITKQKSPKFVLTSPLHFSNSCLHFLTTHCTGQLNYFPCVVLSRLWHWHIVVLIKMVWFVLHEHCIHVAWLSLVFMSPALTSVRPWTWSHKTSTSLRETWVWWMSYLMEKELAWWPQRVWINGSISRDQ